MPELEKAGPSKQAKCSQTTGKQEGQLYGPNPQSILGKSEDNDTSNCCVCGKFSPDAIKNLGCSKIVDWAQCNYCSHWIRMEFCVEMNIEEAKKSTIRCIHCEYQEE